MHFRSLLRLPDPCLSPESVTDSVDSCVRRLPLRSCFHSDTKTGAKGNFYSVEKKFPLAFLFCRSLSIVFYLMLIADWAKYYVISIFEKKLAYFICNHITPQRRNALIYLFILIYRVAKGKTRFFSLVSVGLKCGSFFP